MGRSFGTVTKGRPFFDYVDMDMDISMKKCSIYAVLYGLTMGSTPTVSIKRGSVENTAFPHFLLILCGFLGFEVFIILNSFASILD